MPERRSIMVMSSNPNRTISIYQVTPSHWAAMSGNNVEETLGLSIKHCHHQE